MTLSLPDALPISVPRCGQIFDVDERFVAPDRGVEHRQRADIGPRRRFGVEMPLAPAERAMIEAGIARISEMRRFHQPRNIDSGRAPGQERKRTRLNYSH